MERCETNTETVKRVLGRAGVGYSLKIGVYCSFFFCRTPEGRRFNIRVDGDSIRIWKYAAMGVTGRMWENLLDVFGDVQKAAPQMRMELNEDLDVSWYSEQPLTGGVREKMIRTASEVQTFKMVMDGYWAELGEV